MGLLSKKFVFVFGAYFYASSALGVVFMKASSGFLHFNHSEFVELSRTIKGHERKLILTAFGENTGGPIFLQLEYPDTPFWNSKLEACVKKLSSVEQGGFAKVGPVTFLGHTLTKSVVRTQEINRWRAWYGNTNDSMFVAQNMNCFYQNNPF